MTVVTSCDNQLGGGYTVKGKFTAPTDLILTEVRITQVQTGLPPYSALVSSDPDLTILLPVGPATAFQLIALSDPSIFGMPILTVFENLSFLLLRGQTIYWGSEGSGDLFQLLFTAGNTTNDS